MLVCIRVIHTPAFEEGLEHLCIMQFPCRAVQDILVDEDEVGVLANGNRATCLFNAHLVGTLDGKRAEKTARSAMHSFSSHAVVYDWPKKFCVPVAATSMIPNGSVGEPEEAGASVEMLVCTL